MSLDAEEMSLSEYGSVKITERGISVEGFGGESASCRDVAVLACMWAIGELTREITRTIERPGGGNVSVD